MNNFSSASALSGGKTSPSVILAVKWAIAVIAPLSIVTVLGLSPVQALCFGIILFGIVCLVFGLLPDFVIGLGIVFIPTVLGIVPAEVTLAPLSTWTWWAIIFGFIVGAAISKSGLGLRISHALARRFVRGWTSFIAVIFLVETIFVIIAPFANVATIVIGLSVFLPMANELGYASRSRAYTGAELAVVISNTVSGALLLTGHVMNALAVNLFASFMVITFQSWLVTITPIAALATVLAFFTIVFACRPTSAGAAGKLPDSAAHPSDATRQSDAAPMAAPAAPAVAPAAPAAPAKEAASQTPRPWSANETRVLALTILIIAGFLLQPALKLPFDAGWLAMALSILLFIPKIGMLTGEDIKGINWTFVLFMIGIFSIGGQLSFLGINTIIATFAMPAGIETWGVLPSDLYISSIVVLLHFLCGTIAPLLSTLIPALGAFAQAHGMLLLPLFCTILFCRTRYVFPYQDAMVLLSKGITRNGILDSQITKVGVIFTLLVLFVVTPIGSLYWAGITL